MISCPGDERLARLLEEQLDRPELADIERHLERCDHCQEALEELTRERFSYVEWRPAPGEGPSVGADGGPSMTWPSTPIGSSAEEMPEVEGYEILGLLGHGGMGVVYRARQHGLDRLVALKMIRGGDHAAPEHLGRFGIEARAVARLRHPNVVQIYDIGRADGLPFVALELLEGGSLEGRVAGTPQPERESAELMVTLARAIGEAHRAGVVHRDLKSANVLFTTDGIPKIADFGLAKRLDEEDGQTRSGQVMGSPSFMAPEQARGRGREVGPPADLYSLGAILYEMLTGRPPFKGASAVETLLQVVDDEPIPPTRLRPGLSRDLETICLKCLAKDPRRRYDSAGSLADDLARYLAGRPIQARRVGLLERARKWAGRQPAAASLAALTIASTIALAGAGLRVLEVDRAGRESAGQIRIKAAGVLAEARLALRDKDWDSGLKGLDALRTLRGFEANPRLADLRVAVGDLKDRLEAGLAEQKKFEGDRARYEAFLRLRRRAQILDGQITGAGESGNVEAISDSVGKALSRFPAGPLPDALSPSEKAEVLDGSYELLLIWADAASRPVKGEVAREQAGRALALLDRAAGLRPPTRAYHLIRAGCLADSGDRPGAEAERRAADSTPTVDALGHVLKGQEFYRRQMWLAAIAEFEEALRSDPDQFRAQLLMATCQIQAQRLNQAKANLTACLQREPRAIGLYLLRGFAYGEEGYRRRQVARESGRRLDALEAEAESQFEAAEADYRDALALGPDDWERYSLLVNRGALRLRRDRLDEAVGDFVEAVALKPEAVMAYIPLGQAYKRQGRVDQAIEQFTRGIRLRPEMPALYRSRALTRLDRARPSPEAVAEALDDLSEAIRLDRPGSPESAADRVRRSRVLLVAGRPVEALADAEDALRASPDDPDALLFRVKSLLELKRVEEVVGACDDALGRGKPSAELFELRGLARSSRQEYSGAIQDFTQSLAMDPGRSSPLIHRGWAYLVSEAPKLALLDFDEAIRVAPEEPDAYNGRGFARAIHGQYRAAAADAEESLRRGTPDARTTYNAARVYAKAAAVATAESPRRGLGTLQVADQYQDRAQALIRQAIERLPADRRGAFWRDVVQADPALSTIRQRPKFSQLAGQFGRLAK